MSWRQIHDSVAYSNSLARLTDAAERLYWRLLAQSDPWGRLPGEPSKVRALCAPTVGWSDEHISDLLRELEQERIYIYRRSSPENSADPRTSAENSARSYIQLRDFDEHQPDARRRRGKSKFPDPPFPLQNATPPKSAEVRRTPENSATLRSSPAESESESESERKRRAKGIPKTSSSAHSESLTAQPFVGFLVDESARLGSPLPNRSKGLAAKILAELVAAGASEEALRTGITRMVERGRPISALTDIVREVAVAPPAEPEVDYPLLPPVAYDWTGPL